MDTMTYSEFRNAVRKAKEVCAHVMMYADDQGYACDGAYVKVTKSDLLTQTKGAKDSKFLARWGTAEHNKDILFIN